ncbi:UNVERIFIED_CONTAM: putative transposon Ty5-1 protein [Sesamum indicum]
MAAYSFQQSEHDHCLFFKRLDYGFIGLLVYVDDVLIMAPSVLLISHVKTYHHNLFTIKDLGCAYYFLGLQIARSDIETAITQTKYTVDIISNCCLLQAKSATTPLPPCLQMHYDDDDRLVDPEPYRRLVGCLLYLSLTRPDISHWVQQLNQFIQHPCISHWQTALHLVRYLKGTSAKCLFLPSSNSLLVQAFCDADRAACPNRRSLTGFCIFLCPTLISWKTKKCVKFLVLPPKPNIAAFLPLSVS